MTTMAPYDHDLAMLIIKDEDPHIENPNSRDTLDAIQRTVNDIQYESDKWRYEKDEN